MSSVNKILVLKLLIVILLFLAFKGGTLLYDSGINELTLVDTDCYMRLVRVEALYDTGTWFDNTIHRSNAPFGETLHWSKPLDLLLLAGAVPIALFVPFHSALFWWGYLISPLLMFVSVFALSWAARPLFGPHIRIFIALFFLCQTVLSMYFSFGRPDHHSLLLLLFIVQIGFILRILSAAKKTSRYPYLSGGIAAIGMWISVETLVPIFWVAGTLVIPWIVKAKDNLQSVRRFFLSLSACSLLFLLMERPVGQLLTVEYDKISIVHLASFIGVWLVLRFIPLYNGKQKKWRFFSVIFLGGVTLFILNLIFPLLLKGPYAAVDPRIVPLWLSKVQEVQPLLLNDRMGIAKGIISLGSILWVLPYVLLPLLGKREVTIEWRFFNFGLLIFGGLALYQVRWSAYAELVMLFPMCCVLMMAFDKLQDVRNILLKSMSRVLVISAIALGHYILAYAALFPIPVTQPSPPVHALNTFLNRYGAENIVLAWIDFGPQMLYETKHHVIATPYHRNSEGILYWYEVMGSNTDSDAHRLINQRSVSLIVLCPQEAEPPTSVEWKAGDVFYSRLRLNQYPAWLRPVELPDELKNSFLIYEVIGGVE